MPHISRFEHVSLTARDPMRLARFYCDLLGMRVFIQLPENQGTFLGGPDPQDGPILTFFPLAANQQQPTQPFRTGEHTVSSPHIALGLATLADLRACPADVTRLGGTVLFGVNHGPVLSCHILDPEGNQIELLWRTGKVTQRPVARPVDLTLPEDELLRIVDESVA
jgi:catechol 2,3-dioxygenase-like lactoylglutathione lyase family enzyme